MYNLLYRLTIILVLFAVNGTLVAQNSGLIYEQVMEIKDEFPKEATALFTRNLTRQTPSDAGEYISKAEYLELVEAFAIQLKATKPITLRIDIPYEGKKLQALLYKKEVTTSTYQVKAASGTPTAQSNSVFYRGVLKDNPNSLVSLAVMANSLRMTITDGTGNIEINKINHELYAAYRVADSKHHQNTECSTIETDDLKGPQIEIQTDRGSSSGECIEVYIECDFDSFTKNGSSIQNTEDWALSVMNEVGILYDNAGIPMFVSDILVYDQPDPYLAGGSSGEVLGMMGWVIGNDYVGRLAHVFSTRGLGGGVAYVNVLCATNNGGSFGPYAVSGNMNSNVVPFPVYSWNVMVVAHELGHNVGSLHTHSCVWNGNNTQIDDCGNQATSQGDNSPCYDENNPILPVGGSIMSYCHLIGSIGIDFNIGFHPQVADLLFSRYVGASCVTGENCSGGVAPVADFTYTQTEICNPTEVQFTDLSQNNPTGYQWFFPGGNPNFSTEQNPVVEYSDPGFYDVSLTVSNFAGEDELYLFQVIEVIETPVPDFDVEIEDGTMKFTNLTTGPVFLNFWDFSDGNSSTEENPCYAFEEDGSYLVSLTVESTCGVFEVEKYVDFFTPPVADFEVDITTGCAPMTVNFTNQSSSNAVDFFWTFEGGNPESSTEENPSVSYDSVGVFEVVLMVTNDQGEDTLEMNNFITVENTPTIGFEYEMDSLNVTFTNQSTGFTSLSWDFGDGSTSEMMNPTHTYAEEGIYEVTLEVSNICDTIMTTQIITLSSLPMANYSANITEGCLPLTIEFTNASSLNTDTWSWSFPGGDPTTSSEENPVITYSQAGTFDVQLVVSNESGADTIENINFISVGDIPTAIYDYSTNDLEVSFTDLSSDYEDISWDFGDGNTSNEVNPMHTYSMDGVYEVTLTTTNSCGSNTSIQSISVSTLPSAAFTANMIQDCVPFIVEFTNNSSNNSISFDWSFPGGNPSTSNDENPIITYDAKGIYDVSLVVSSLAGYDTLLMEDYITTYDVPVANFEYDLLSEFEFSFTNLSLDGESYVWDFGDGANSNEENPTHLYSGPGTYLVKLTVTNNCGQQTYEEEITISDITSTEEIEAFTTLTVFPNPNEGIFTFTLHAFEAGEGDLNIYNTLGQSILQEKVKLNAGFFKKTIQLEAAEAGVYLLVFRKDNHSQISKIILK